MIWYNDLFFSVKVNYTDGQRHVRLSHRTCWMWAEGRGRDGGIRGRNTLLLLLNELQQSTPRGCTLSVQLQEALFHTAHAEGVRWRCLTKKTEKLILCESVKPIPERASVAAGFCLHTVVLWDQVRSCLAEMKTCRNTGSFTDLFDTPDLDYHPWNWLLGRPGGSVQYCNSLGLDLKQE